MHSWQFVAGFLKGSVHYTQLYIKFKQTRQNGTQGMHEELLVSRNLAGQQETQFVERKLVQLLQVAWHNQQTGLEVVENMSQ